MDDRNPFLAGHVGKKDRKQKYSQREQNRNGSALTGGILYGRNPFADVYYINIFI
jgi:hypothetical protein